MHQIQGWRERSRARLPPSSNRPTTSLRLLMIAYVTRLPFCQQTTPPGPPTTTASSLNGPVMAQASGALFTACERCSKWQLQKP